MTTQAKKVTAKKKLIVKGSAGRSGVGKWCKEQIMMHYNNETELDTVKLAEQAREKFESKTNQRCIQWYIHDMRKNGLIE